MDYIIIQAGGRGSRLGYLTKNKPKGLIPVANLPLIFHLFKKYPDKRFLMIADYKKEVIHDYLFAFADVKYQIVDAVGKGTCAGIKQAADLIPDGSPFMLIWCDLLLPEQLDLPEEYKEGCPQDDYIGISETFSCRWSYRNNIFYENSSTEDGVAGFFLFTDKKKLDGIPKSGEFVRWLQWEHKQFRRFSLGGTKEFGLLEEYKKLEKEKCRPFNRIILEGDILTKEALTKQGRKLAGYECLWYEKAKENNIDSVPRIFSLHPIKMEYIKGKNIYEYDLSQGQKKQVLEKLITALHRLHITNHIPADSFSLKEAYFYKTMRRLLKIEDMVPFAREREIVVNGKRCRNIFFHKEEFERKLDRITCTEFHFIHGDCTFSNLMIRENGEPVLIDPRGYFGYTELYGDVRYDWAKLYYSIIGNYDRFNLKDFILDIMQNGISLKIESNHWEDMEEEFFKLTGADKWEIQFLHAVIWLSLTTYAWHDFDSICAAFYNGLYYLEDVL